MPVSAAEADLEQLVADCYHDPLGFVRAMYPWGEPGPLQDHTGPDTWQTEFLSELGRQVRARAFDGQHAVAPIRMAASSGHGIGKSVLVAWLVNWIMSTRPMARGTITANTHTQLQTKTWASVQKWTKRCLTGHWFACNMERLYHPSHKEAWFVSAQSCKEENSEAFAGQHAADSTSFYIFDEDSAVPDVIHDVAAGGLTDGEPMMFLFGNPTRSSGAFYRACFGVDREYWTTVTVDSRSSKFTNKALIDEWQQQYGEDSDFFRVRVRGLPPAASDLQFIDSARVSAAQRRAVDVLADEPLVAGFDVARGGLDECVIRFRRGLDGKPRDPIRIPGEQARDSMRLVTVAADLLASQPIHTLFVDGTGIGGPIVDRLRQLGHRNVLEVQFGAESPDPKYANMRAFMWGKMRDWLARGAIDATPGLEIDLTAPGYTHDARDRVVLESKEHMKKRGIDSPDDGDALALTFAQAIRPKATKPYIKPLPPDW